MARQEMIWFEGPGNDQLFRSNSKDVLTGGPGNDQFNCCAGIQDLARATQYTRCVVNLLNEQVDIDPDVYNHYLVVLLGINTGDSNVSQHSSRIEDIFGI